MDDNTRQPVRHLVICRFKDGTSDERIRVFLRHFQELSEKIPGIIGFEQGANNSPEGLSRGLTHACMLTFVDEQARDAYLPHPLHRQFGAEEGPIVAEFLVFDYTPA